VSIADPRTLQERQEVAREFAAQFKVSLPVLVDTIDDQVDLAYSAMPDRIYVIDARGKIAYKGRPGPSGFRVPEVPPVLDKLLGVSLASTLRFPGKPAGSRFGFPEEMRDRINAVLERMGLDEKESRQVVRAAERKMAAHRDLMRARRTLLNAARGDKDVTRALTGFKDALKKYDQAVDRIDRDLDAAIGYSKKPKLLATLTALGLIGSYPAQPMSGLLMAGGGPGGGR
jgi:hypothetical protein